MAWIFRCAEPLADLVRSSRSIELAVDQHQSLVSKGDLVFLWAGDKPGGVAAVGILQSSPYRVERTSKKHRARVGVAVVLAEPLTADECRRDPLLKSLAILHRSDQTNFGLSRAVKDRLLARIGEREPSLAEQLNLPADSIPRSTKPDGPARQSKDVSPEIPDRKQPPWEGLDPDAVKARAQAWLADPKTVVLLALRRAAAARIGNLLLPDSLAGMSVEEFASEIESFGYVTTAGTERSLAEALEEWSPAGTNKLKEALDSGAITVKGNLSWSTTISVLGACNDQDEAGCTLRLRAALSHLLTEGRSLGVRIERMRRAFEALWPETATGILSITAPEQFVPYDRRGVEGARLLGARREWKSTVDDFAAYCDFVKWVAEAAGLPDLDSAHAFLGALSISASTTHAEPPSIEAQQTEKSAPVSEDRQMDSPAADNGATRATEGQAVFALYQQLRQSGVVTTLGQVLSIYVSLKTVPFIAFEGATGSGKNHLIRSFARAIGGTLYSCPLTNESVGGSSDAPIRLRDLLGVLDTRARRFYPDVLYRALLDAHEHPDDLVFVFVDTPEGWQEDGWLAEYMRLSDLQAEGDVSGALVSVLPSGGTLDPERYRAEFPFPPNAVLVLSVVGDGASGQTACERANIITLGAPDLSFDALRTAPTSQGTTPRLLAGLLAEHCRQVVPAIPQLDKVELWNNELIHMNGFLEPLGIPIGYRLRNEILRYIAYSDELSGQLPYGISFPLESAFDFQICQRILPRVLMLLEKDDSGADVLGDLLAYAQGSQGPAPRFPHAAARLQALQRRLD